MKASALLGVGLLLLALVANVASGLVPIVHAQTTQPIAGLSENRQRTYVLTNPLQANSTCGGAAVPPQVTTVKNVILGLFIGIQAIIYVIIGLAWITGNLMWSAPTRSMIIKKGGQQQMELAGIALFLTLMGPGIFALIIFLAGQFGVGTWSFC